MNIFKIAGLVGALVAIVAAFVGVPFSPAILAVLGAVVGWNIAAEDNVRVIVSAVALGALAGTFGSIPVVGPSLTAIIGNVGVLIAGAALLIILRNVVNRLKP
ncbi:MAG: hypothetical protein WCH32_15730 [Pseudomonadota bacterium]